MVRNTYEVQNIGDLLREKRKQLGQDIKQVAEHTRIRSEYLLALESGKFDKFPAGVYAKGFLKKYAKYLGINPERAAAMYRREMKTRDPSLLHQTSYIKNKIKSAGFSISPGRIFTIIIVLLIVGFGYYLFSQVATVLKQPLLKVTEPIAADALKTNNGTFTTALNKISLRGEIEIGSKLTLNGSPVNVNNLQIFEITDLPLQVGENNFKLVAESQFGQKSELNIKVIREATAEPTTPPTTTPTSPPTTVDNPATGQSPIVAAVSIEGRSAFIQVKVDGTPIFAGTLDENESKEFQANTSLSISTPRPDAVKVTINGTTFELENTREHIFTLDANGGIRIENQQ